MPRKTARAHGVGFVRERRGRVLIEQLPDDPEYFHVFDGRELVDVYGSEAEAREAFVAVGDERYGPADAPYAAIAA